ncbi:MAG: hypothetical protein ABI863_12115 [Ginsengibacter sp.]
MKLIIAFFVKPKSHQSPGSEAISEAFKETFKEMGYRFNDSDNKAQSVSCFEKGSPLAATIFKIFLRMICRGYTDRKKRMTDRKRTHLVNSHRFYLVS